MSKPPFINLAGTVSEGAEGREGCLDETREGEESSADKAGKFPSHVASVRKKSS
jgi:hypothetical protein